MTSTIAPHTASPCFQLKGSMVTMMTLELYRFDELSLHRQLQTLVAQAPRFFENTPVIVSLENLHNPDSAVDMPRCCALCQGFGINLIAIRGGNATHRANAAKVGLACLPAQPAPPARQTSKLRQVPQNVEAVDDCDKSTDKPAIQKAERDTVTPLRKAPAQPPKIINTPIRSGQQVFHDGDLILTGPVNPGAEVLVTGHLHAYGAFRGRALVGVKGNTQARIFCTRFEAELVSINGHYKMASIMDKSLTRQTVQVYLHDDALVIEKIT